MNARLRSRQHEQAHERTELYNLRAERAVIGAALIRSALLQDVLDLNPHAFFRVAHQRIWDAMIRLQGEHVAVDMITLVEELERVGQLEECGGVAYLTSLADGIPVTTNIREYARIVDDLARRRELRSALTQAASRITSADHDEDVISEVAALLRPSVTGANDTVTAAQAAEKFLTWLEERQQPGARTYGERAGMTTFDQRFGGLLPGFTVLAARPSHGKTALALTWADYIARVQGEPVLFVSAEMYLHMITARWLSLVGGMRAFDVLRGTADPEECGRAAGMIAEAPMSFMTGRVTPSMIRARALAMAQPPRAIFVDYIQILRPDADAARRDRYLQIKAIAEALKSLSHELEVPVVTLAQLKREAEDRKEPELRDLRESGDIEQEADSGYLLHRPDDADRGSLIIAKQRNGPKGRLSLAFDKATMRYYEDAETW